MSRTLTPCGTLSAYKRHLRNGEEPCADCRAANAAYHAEHRATHPERIASEAAYNAARHRALERLAVRHDREFARLLHEERAS